MSETSQLPKWDLRNVYPALESAEFEQAKQDLVDQVYSLEKYLEETGIDPSAPAKDWAPEELTKIVAGFLEQIAAAQELHGTIRAYLNSYISTDSYNEAAKKTLSLLEPLFVRLGQVESVKFMGWVGKIGDQIEGILDADPIIASHSFYLTNLVEQSEYMMSPAE
jgi:oligoendopeptidase F